MAERLFSHDDRTGMSTYFSASDDGQDWSFRYSQETAPLLDANKEAQTEGFDRRSEMWHAASIPAVVLMEWATKHGVRYWDKNHSAGVRRLLNSSEYRHLRRASFQL